MSSDSDISAALPEPPPPRPARRDAAIAAALRRFDGEPADRPSVAKPVPWRGRIARPQLAAFVTIALVALIGLPVWMSGDHGFSSVSREAPAGTVPGPVSSPVPHVVQGPVVSEPVAGRLPPPAPPTLAANPPPAASLKLEPVPASPPSAVVADSGNAPVDALNRDARGIMRRDEANMQSFSAPAPQAAEEKMWDKDVAAARRNWTAPGYAAPPPPPPPSPPPPQAAPAPPSAFAAMAPRSRAVAGLVGSEDGADIAVTGTRVSKSSNADLSSADIVVTGQLQSLARRAGRGDWNACTVNDPNQRLSACKKLVDPAASGAAGRAATHIADGLSLAWQDDLDGAIAAFDQAIAVSPRLSFAYLNRGQAYLRKGELTRALADLDQAVRYAPNAARNYYSRSLVRRQQGDTRRAEADEARAIDLDERYEVLFR